MAGIIDAGKFSLASAASGSFTWTSGTYEALKILGRNIVLPNASVEVWLRVSIDGSTFLSTSIYDQVGKHIRAPTSIDNDPSTTTTRVDIGPALNSNTAARALMFEANLLGIETTGWAGITVQAVGRNSTGVLDGSWAGTSVETASEILGFQILNSAGDTFTSGDIWIYEIAKP